jgi:hypothetical protein
MHAPLELPPIARLLANDEPFRSVAAFERTARAETALVCTVALVGLLSVLVSIVRMGSLEPLEAAASPVALREHAESSSVDAGRRSMLPLAASAEDRDAELPALQARPRPEDRGRWTEHDHRADYLAFASAEELAEHVASLLVPDGNRTQQLAALQALVLRELAAAPDLGARAARELPLDSTSVGESVPRAFVAWLGRQGARSITARKVLDSIAADARVDAQLRAAALRAWIAVLPEDELEHAAIRFGREADDTVYASALSSLEQRRGLASAAEPE